MAIDFSADVPAPADTTKSPELLLLVQYLESARDLELNLGLQLKEASKNRRVLEEKTIPEALADMGIRGHGSLIKLLDGRAITLDEQEYVSIPAATKPEAYQWLKDHGFGAHVKEELKETVAVSGLRPMASDLPQNLFKVNTVRKVKIK